MLDSPARRRKTDRSRDYDTAPACSTVCGARRLDGSPTGQPWTAPLNAWRTASALVEPAPAAKYPAAATPVPTVRMSKSSQLPSTIAAARATIERGANMQEDRDRWLPLEHRWAARDFPRKAR